MKVGVLALACALGGLGALGLPGCSDGGVVSAPPGASDAATTDVATGECVPGGVADLSTPPEDLASYCVIDLVDGRIVPKPGVLAYSLNTPLFSDHAIKERTVWVPEGGKATSTDGEAYDFPVGSIITKSFGFADDLRKATPRMRWIETRVMAKTATGWKMNAYTWNEAQTRATLDVAGGVHEVSFIDARGETVAPKYLVPNANQSKKCHQRGAGLVTLGPTPANLRRDERLARWVERGVLERVPEVAAMPAWDDPAAGTVETRARAWLDVNCAHCHREDGSANTTGLILRFGERDPSKLGVCKSPVAAGRATGGLAFDVVPGRPEESILVHRLESNEPAVAMPEIGRSLGHAGAIDLVRGWIKGLPGGCGR